MHEILATLEQWIANPKLASGARAAFVLVCTTLLARVAGAATAAALSRASAQQRMLARRVAFYAVFGLGVVSALDELGFSVHTLLGAAGIVTVALGLAAQTSTSNLIAGLFLIAERPFVVGDVIRVGSTTGEVLSIDLLSIKLRTYDNLYVRVPNDSVVKTDVVNLTYFPIRRIDLSFGVAQTANLKRVRELLFEVAHRHPLALDEPAPLFLIQGFANGAVQLQFSIWVARPNYLELKSSIHEQIKEHFEHATIPLPSTENVLRLGDEPVAVRLLTGDEGNNAKS